MSSSKFSQPAQVDDLTNNIHYKGGHLEKVGEVPMIHVGGLEIGLPGYPWHHPSHG